MCWGCSPISVIYTPERNPHLDFLFFFLFLQRINPAVQYALGCDIPNLSECFNDNTTLQIALYHILHPLWQLNGGVNNNIKSWIYNSPSFVYPSSICSSTALTSNMGAKQHGYTHTGPTTIEWYPIWMDGLGREFLFSFLLSSTFVVWHCFKSMRRVMKGLYITNGCISLWYRPYYITSDVLPPH